jgi:hypothetical protein
MTNTLLAALVLSVAAVALVLARGLLRLERRFDAAIQHSFVPELSRSIATIDRPLESAIPECIVSELARGFAALDRHLETAIQRSLTPIIGLLEQFEDAIIVVNIGGSVALDIEWAISGTNKSGSIPYLSPQQSWHLQVGKQAKGELTVNYKSLSGDGFSRTFDVSRIMASENHLTLA